VRQLCVGQVKFLWQTGRLYGRQRSILDGSHSLLDAFPAFRGKRRYRPRLLIFGASVCGGAKKAHLLVKATTPTANEQVKLQTQALRQRKWPSHRRGLQSGYLFATR
jgi:hypothetical protein